MPEETTYTLPTYAWEGECHVAPGGTGRNSLAGTVRAGNVKNMRVSPAVFTEVENTLKKHEGDKAFTKGRREVQILFDLSLEYTKDSSGVRTYAPDVQMVLDAAQNRNSPLTMFSVTPYGTGFVGDFEVFAGEIPQDGDDVATIPITCKPFCGAAPVERFTAE